MENIWIFNFLNWVFFGPIGLINFLIFIIFIGIIYAGFLTAIAFALQRPWRELHHTVKDNVSSFYAVVVIFEALSSVWDAIAFSLSQLIRALILPIKLLSGWFINLLTGPVETLLNRGEDKLDEAMEKDAVRQANREMLATKKFVKREIRKAKARQIRLEAKQAKDELRIPNFSAEEFEKSDSELANDVILRNNVTRCEKALESGELSNPAIKTVAAFLNCSQTYAKEVRNELHKNGILIKHQTGRMSYVNSGSST